MKIQSQSSSIFNRIENTSNKLNQQLATGKRVNSAADDAAALQIIDRLTSQQNGYGQSIRNAYDGISYAQTADSALSGVNDAVSRIRELSIQAGSGALTDNDRQALQEEVSQLQTQITETFENTTFGGAQLFNGESATFQIGPDALTTKELTQTDGSFASAILSVDISTEAGAQAAIDVADTVSQDLNTQRTQLGAFENTVSSTIRNADNQRENIAASQSRIQDTDYARAVSEQTANDILSQASIALRGQANQSASAVLGLL
ncbi:MULTISPECIES: flagellin [Pseudoalteromonas]|uniref:Flagellin n=1 Tax=Pseudoalteromonas amylolytica TaxID=1859457 RepID=A0A1S1MVR7_9GAMM|nr:MULTISPECIES: flagellin [Pseudoalteromonas]MCF6434705.1 flagellin [Pseudoalteromonas sp. MMG022]OHU87576.1 flagellin [Pseudoalteromonas sp. JW3]OHU91019.1 flagellin [Pseudoalteromonas amylolytica]